MIDESVPIERARRLKDNEDWKWAKTKLETIIQIYESIGTLDYRLSDTSLAKELRRRRGVSSLLTSWLEEIEGTGTLDIPKIDEDKTIIRFE
jgi:hypothetical protein